MLAVKQYKVITLIKMVRLLFEDQKITLAKRMADMRLLRTNDEAWPCQWRTVKVLYA